MYILWDYFYWANKKKYIVSCIFSSYIFFYKMSQNIFKSYFFFQNKIYYSINFFYIFLYTPAKIVRWYLWTPYQIWSQMFENSVMQTSLLRYNKKSIEKIYIFTAKRILIFGNSCAGWKYDLWNYLWINTQQGQLFNRYFLNWRTKTLHPSYSNLNSLIRFQINSSSLFLNPLSL